MDNVYAAPTAEVGDLALPRIRREFFVVAPRKLALLFVATMGLYGFYLWYQHWALYRHFNKQSISAVARSIFQVFFIHSFTSEVDHRLQRSSIDYPWSPKALASAYVIMLIASGASDRLASNSIGSPWTDLVALVVLLPMTWVLVQIQRAANLAGDDPEGDSNARLTWANWLWLTLFGMVWLLAAISFYDMFVGIPALDPGYAGG